MLDIQDLHIRFRNAPEGREAVKGISLHMDEGEILGLVGESGSGKTVTAMALAGLLSHAKTELSGAIFFQGLDLLQASRETVRALRGKEIAVVFQEPMTSMDPVMRIGPQVEEALVVHTKLSAEERRARALQAMADAELPEPGTLYRKYPHELSGGMLQRAMVAAAIISEPKLLICDEPTTALDVTIQAQILKLLHNLQEKYQLTIIYITHDLGVVANVADRIAVMYAGDIVEVGLCEEIFYNAKHPYSWALLSSLPQLGVKGEPLYSIKGTPPNLFNEIKGDAFAPRNPQALKIDFEIRPPYFEVSPTHRARTWLLDPRAPTVELPALIARMFEKWKEAAPDVQ